MSCGFVYCKVVQLAEVGARAESRHIGNCDNPAVAWERRLKDVLAQVILGVVEFASQSNFGCRGDHVGACQMRQPSLEHIAAIGA